ncbi:neuroblast differentiation-associated protein AHNAK-like [Arapaima gigas]
MKMPKFGIKGPKMEGPDVDVDLPKADIDIKGPKVDIEGPEIDVEGPDGKIKGPKFKMPSISGPKISMPEMDFNLTGPKLKGDVDVSVPKFKAGGPEGEVSITGPDVKLKKPGFDADIHAPDVSLEGADLNIKGTKFKKPKFNLGGKAPKADSKIPESDVSLDAPDIDVNLKGKKGKFKVPKIKGKMKKPDANVDLASPEIDMDVETPDIHVKGPKVKKPLFGKLNFPDVEFDIKSPKGKVDGSLSGSVKTADMELPSTGLKADVKLPHAELQGADIEGPDVKMKKSKIKMPKFNISGPKLKTPDFDVKGAGLDVPDVNVSLGVPEVDMKGPDVEAQGKVKLEGVNFDIEAPEGKLKGHGLQMPSLDIKGPKISAPDFNLKGPKLKGDIDASGEIKSPNLDIEGLDVNVKGPEGGFKMPKMEGPDFDVNLPKADINIRGPKVDVEGPELEGLDGKIKGPKFGMPSTSGLKMSVPDLDLNLKGPKLKGDADVYVPKVEGDIKIPKFDSGCSKVDIDGPDGSFKMSKIKMPTFGLKGHDVEGPDVDVNISKADIDIKGPKVAIEGPELGLVGPDGKIKGPKFSGPSISGPQISVPDVDLNLKGSNVTLEGPKVSFPDSTFEGQIKLPRGEVKGPDVTVKTPDMDLETPELKGKKSKFKFPKFGFGTPKLEGPDIDINVEGPKVSGSLDSSADINVPKSSLTGGAMGEISGDSKGLSVNVQSPDVRIKGPEVTGGLNIQGVAEAPESTGGMEYPETKVTFPKLKVPKFGIALPQLEGPEVGVDVGSGVAAGGGDISIQSSGPSANISSQSLELHGPEMKASGGKTKVKMPKLFGKSKTKGGSAADLSVEEPSVELSSSGGDVKGSKGLSASSGELPGKIVLEGSPGLSVSPKSKSASLDLFKKSRHRSSSLSDEGELASPTSPSGHLHAEGGASLEAGDVKVKGKKGKLKFGTFGGFGAKSKGSYEVSLGEEGEAWVEGSGGVSLPSKKSRMSSSSSSDGGAKGGFRFPRVELAVSPKK